VTRLLAAEWHKVVTLRWPKIALPLVLVADAALAFALPFTHPISVLSDAAQQRLLLTQASGLAALVAWLLAAGLVGGERSAGTLVTTFLVEPVRERVLLAKLLFAALVGLVVALVDLALSFGAVVTAMAVLGVPVHLDAEVSLTVLGVVLAAVLRTVLYFGLGAAIRSTKVALAVILGWWLAVEPLLDALAASLHAEWNRFSFGNVLLALQRPLDGQLSVWAAAVMATGYVAVAVAAGWAITVRQDVA
jgi:ABC-2 type transport system permease protein